MSAPIPDIPLKTVLAADFRNKQFDRALDPATVQQAQQIVETVRQGGESALRELAIKFADRTENQPIWIAGDELESAANRIDAANLELLNRVAKRIENFARAQLESLRELTVPVPGGTAGHTIQPIERVGCYAPAGRFPLPSTVLMTAVTARVAGCRNVVVATPNPGDLMLAAAHVAEADRVLAVGGAQSIAALAYGTESSLPCDLICGPGNRWVTAAKKIVNGDVGIDMLAGPSELVAVADETANPATVAADLLAQAEHDVDARPFVVTNSATVADSINRELVSQLESLPSRDVAIESLSHAVAVICENMDQAVSIANDLAPEHLELHCADADAIAASIKHAGCLFIGHQSAEVFGDYGVGPNHTLPTSGTARWSAGLNVFTFLRVRTWLKIDSPPQQLIDDTCRLAELEGLIGHSRASSHRR